MTTLRWGILSTADIGRKKVIPGVPRGVPLGSTRSRRARRDAPRRSQRSWGFRGPTVRTRRCSQTLRSMRSISRSRTTSTRSGRAPPRGPASTCCARKPLAMNGGGGRADGGGEPGRRRPADGGVHVPAAPEVGRGRELVAAGRIGRLVAVDSWFSYFNDDPANIRNHAERRGRRPSSTSAATRSMRRGCCSARSRGRGGAAPPGVGRAASTW